MGERKIRKTNPRNISHLWSNKNSSVNSSLSFILFYICSTYTESLTFYTLYCTCLKRFRWAEIGKFWFLVYVMFLSEEKCTAVTPETPNCTDTKRDFDAVVFAIFPRYTASFIITMAGHTFPTPAFILLCTCLKKERRGGFTAQKIVARVLGIQHFSIARCYWRSLPRIACSSKSFASLNPEAEICIYVKNNFCMRF